MTDDDRIDAGAKALAAIVDHDPTHDWTGFRDEASAVLKASGYPDDLRGAVDALREIAYPPEFIASQSRAATIARVALAKIDADLTTSGGQ